MGSLYDVVLAGQVARGNLRSPCVQQLDATSGRGSIHMDQPHASGFLYYHRAHGTPHRYVGTVPDKFTNHVYTRTGFEKEIQLTENRRQLRHKKYDITTTV